MHDTLIFGVYLELSGDKTKKVKTGCHGFYHDGGMKREL